MKNHLSFFFILLFGCTNIQAQGFGCTDKLASNFNNNVIYNDGSCIYPSTNIVLTSSLTLDASLKETSGLIYWGNYFWSHNDDQDNNIYAIHPSSGQIDSTITLNGLQINDWEEIQHDSNFIYIGDIGNNATGIRQNLVIYKISKNSIFTPQLDIDTINFHYATQTDFSTSSSNTTNFDCEAFIVSEDSIYLFSKEWTNKKSTIYSIPNQAGHHTAKPIFELDVNGLITGACRVNDKNAIILCGYSNILQPFIFMITDLHAFDFSKSNKRKLLFNTLLGYQIEAISTSNSQQFYLTNEQFSIGGTTILQQIHTVDLNQFYPQKNNISVQESPTESMKIYPNPSTNKLIVENAFPGIYEILNNLGQVILRLEINTSPVLIDVSNFPAGNYYLKNSNISISGKFIIGN